MQTPAPRVPAFVFLAAASLLALSGCASQRPQQRLSLQEYMDYQLALAANPQAEAEFSALEVEKAHCEQVLKR